MLTFQTCRSLREAGFQPIIDNDLLETFGDIFGLQEVYNLDEIFKWLQIRGIHINLASKTLNEDIINQLKEKEYI